MTSEEAVLRRQQSVCLGSPEQLNPATSIDSQWPLKSMPVPKWRITIRACSQRSASSVVDLSEDRNTEYKQHQLHIYGRRVV
ncbi:hypothetical protein PABG_02510 [Paracoccidioides brasiliensis Pb03]|nr:hypothetical protein PABG_02510 [Paracoccidioides brasiliensis Pb03]